MSVILVTGRSFGDGDLYLAVLAGGAPQHPVTPPARTERKDAKR